MKAISIRQPWAWAILHAGKRVENRTRELPGKYVGVDLLLHTGKATDEAARAACAAVLGYDPPSFGDLPLGAVVGIVRFDGQTFDVSDPWAEPGLQHWIIDRVHALPEPVLGVRGMLGFFEPSPEAVDAVDHAARLARLVELARWWPE